MKHLLLLILILFAGCSRILRDEPFRVHYIPSAPPRTGQTSEFRESKQVLIVIDPGHGGEDRGTISLQKPSYQEKQLTLATAQFLQHYLQDLGYQTRMTRENDVFISPLDRAQLANQMQPHLFVSVHYNSAPSVDAHGIEIFYHLSEKDPERTKESKALAASILSQVLQNTQAKSRGVKTANFAVIRETKMPAVLIEGGFLTNADEMERIKNPIYLKQIAWGIAQGVDRYLGNRSKIISKG
jgi:N-acetylmuramoyl-L-alanine amidase